MLTSEDLDKIGLLMDLRLHNELEPIHKQLNELREELRDFRFEFNAYAYQNNENVQDHEKRITKLENTYAD
jgi:uncharacterized protein Yka (UPF0111/DUF47 family)